MIRFLKDWTLPIAMITGIVGYFILADVSCLSFLKPGIREMVNILTPTLIFAQLLLTFCKIEPRELIPVRWHLWVLLVQVVLSVLIALILISGSIETTNRAVLEGLMVCLICPTATAAAVVTAKLGGSASTLTTYTLISNLMAAIAVPLVFPLVEPHAQLTFWMAFAKILSKVFPLLLAPFFTALLLRSFLPRVHDLLGTHSGIAFYIWAVALTIVMGQTTRSLVHSTASVPTILLIALGGLIACCLQFIIGKKIGSHYQDRISAGQALGQKNTVLAIWMACTYLNPVCSLAPGSYVIWQNIINSWQLWKRRT